MLFNNPDTPKPGIKKRITFLKEISSGMHWLHSKNILHLNLKPSNILLTSSLSIKISDYGLGHIARKYTAKKLDLTSACYVAPELFRKEQPTMACDVYSLGILACYILTNGRDLYQFTSVSQLIQNVKEGGRPELPNISSPILKKKNSRVVGWYS